MIGPFLKEKKRHASAYFDLDLGTGRLRIRIGWPGGGGAKRHASRLQDLVSDLLSLPKKKNKQTLTLAGPEASELKARGNWNQTQDPSPLELPNIQRENTDFFFNL